MRAKTVMHHSSPPSPTSKRGSPYFFAATPEDTGIHPRIEASKSLLDAPETPYPTWRETTYDSTEVAM
jgi:hypothetical protein